MSNLIKSGFVAFSQDQTLVIDANDNKIIKGIDEAIEEAAATQEETSIEDAFAEAMIEDADLEDVDSYGTLERSAKTTDQGRENAEQIVLQAKNEAQNIVNQAHDEVEQMRAAIYEESEQIKEDARSEGYQAGYQEGLQAVQTEYQQKEQELQEQMEQYSDQMQQEQKAFIEDMEHNMVEWLCQMIPSITGVMIENQKDVLFYMVNEAIKDLDDCKQFVVKVSESDYAKLSERKEDIYGFTNPNVDIELFADPKLSEKQCLIETENGVVDASLDEQLSNLNKALRLMIKE
ncbi:MAG: hypothetical protein J6A03_01595 [Lachnospiraceae bacterium]|nr:hypothetical protein [Lachnospiraceae bacterium]